MELKELQNRLTQIISGITPSHNPETIQSFVHNLMREFGHTPAILVSVTSVEGYDTEFVEYQCWDESQDGPIPGIKLFKDINIYLEREYCEY